MSRFRPAGPRQIPGINTAALPDMIFTLLFFFMIVTHMRTVPVHTPLNLPTAEELQKLEEKSLIIYVIAGKETPIQLNSDFVRPEDMPVRLDSLKNNLPAADREKMIAVLRIDRDLPMGTVNDIKRHLRQAGILTIHYSAEKSRSK
jgi:biopolymer transport protein ExbD